MRHLSHNSVLKNLFIPSSSLHHLSSCSVPESKYCIVLYCIDFVGVVVRSLIVHSRIIWSNHSYCDYNTIVLLDSLLSVQQKSTPSVVPRRDETLYCFILFSLCSLKTIKYYRIFNTVDAD